MKTLLWCCLLVTIPQAVTLRADAAITDDTPAFRIIPIPKRAHGYSKFESTAIISKADLDAFMSTQKVNVGQGFENVLNNAALDFSKEALVLLRHEEGSGSMPVQMVPPVLRGRTLLVEIRGYPIPPGYYGTADMAYYCYAIAISKSHVSELELTTVQGVGRLARDPVPPIIFSVIEKKARKQ